MVMKILHMFPAAKSGGAPIAILNFIKDSKETQNIIITTAIDKEIFERLKRYSYKIYDIYILGVSLQSIIKVLRIVLKEKPDIIHCHGKGGAFYGFVSSLLLGQPAKVVYTFHGFHNKYSGIKSFFYWLYEKSFSFFVDRYIAVSESEQEKVLKSKIISDTKIVVVYPGIDMVYEELSEERRLLLKKFNINIVSLSRISPQKDLETMLKAFKILKAKTDKKVALHIIGGYIEGDKNYANNIFSLQKELGLDKEVFFWNEIPFVGHYLHSFDIYLSTALWEGLPAAVIEAMLSKIPVVATDCIGNVDVVKDGENGYLAKCQNAEDISDKLVKCINAMYEKRLIDNAYVFAEENFSVKTYVKNIEDIYNELLH